MSTIIMMVMIKIIKLKHTSFYEVIQYFKKIIITIVIFIVLACHFLRILFYFMFIFPSPALIQSGKVAFFFLFNQTADSGLFSATLLFCLGDFRTCLGLTFDNNRFPSHYAKISAERKCDGN